jgi:hypothetical protein
MIEHHGNFLPIDTPLSFGRHLFVIYLSKSAAQRMASMGSLLNAASQTEILPSRMTQTSTPKPHLAAAFGVLHFDIRYVTSCGGRVKKVVMFTKRRRATGSNYDNPLQNSRSGFCHSAANLTSRVPGWVLVVL